MFKSIGGTDGINILDLCGLFDDNSVFSVVFDNSFDNDNQSNKEEK